MLTSSIGNIEVQYRCKDCGKYYFKNLLFTVACINPHLKSDPGAAKLFQAEKTRYLFKNKNAHSDSRTTDDFLLKYYDKLIKRLNPKHPDFRKNLETFLRVQNLGRFIVGHRDFKYDGENATSTDELQDMLQALEDIASSLGISYSFFRREFKRKCRISPGQFRLEQKLTKAKELLENTNMSIAEISSRLHFDCIGQFSTFFKKKTGTPPLEYRKNGIKKD